MSKFNKDNSSDYTVIKCKDVKPCSVCGCDTHYIDFIYETRLCSEECSKALTDKIMNNI